MTWLIQENEISGISSDKRQMGSFVSLQAANSVVAYKEVQKDKIDIDRALKVELNNMRSLRHDHLVQFLGANLTVRPGFLITEYCSRGSLQDVLENGELKLDWNFRHSLTNDIVKGLFYLEKSALKFHGNLKSSNCVVDSRFVLKLTDFGLHSLRQSDNPIDQKEHHYWRNLLWTAPEILRQPHEILNKLCSSVDVYAFGIILHEVIVREGTFFLGEDVRVNPKDSVCLPHRND
ncbi:hypothetical protein TCAL_16472 [Tigriopus californicus]|uniref:guanylate cyclase n=1 Tax=Tigriopus californicus TaxID=6832 RepID=A0A553NS06_TIGCA|nr:hypothetical protein TCAL_16472 [Tigriopus californicus]